MDATIWNDVDAWKFSQELLGIVSDSGTQGYYYSYIIIIIIIITENRKSWKSLSGSP